jgi:uncharacterized protein DUF6064
MSEWWTYTLSDFLLFSPRVYYRLFELHNQALWPAQTVTLVLGSAIFLLLFRAIHRTDPAANANEHFADRLVPALLGVLWIWIAWAFFFQRYASINWAAPYVAPVFACEGALLIATGTVGRTLTFTPARGAYDLAGLALLAAAVVGYPLLAPVMGRPWLSAEVFGIAPDPTAVATLAVLALARGHARWFLAPIPLLWCLITGATLWTMEANDLLVAPLAALLALAIGYVRKPTATIRGA